MRRRCPMCNDIARALNVIGLPIDEVAYGMFEQRCPFGMCRAHYGGADQNASSHILLVPIRRVGTRESEPRIEHGEHRYGAMGKLR